MIAGSPEWQRVMTASKVPAVLGLSPWESPWSLWHKMRGDVPPDQGNDDTRRGHYLEPAILAWWRDCHTEYGAVPTEQPTFEKDGWAAATPDLLARASCAVGNEPGGFAEVLVEAKSTAQEWDDLPPYYLAQVIWQMHVSGVHRCYVPVIGPRLTFSEYVVDYADYADDALPMEAICREFYDSLADEVAPPLDSSLPTYQVARRLHPDIDRGEYVEADHDLARRLIDWTDEAKRTERTLRACRSSALNLMGRAQYLTYNGRTIARRQATKHGVSLVVTATPDSDWNAS